jgi:L-aspartate oxidase
MAGRTSVAGLYAVGEAASTGVHGANRLASNSLTEALIAGRRAGDLLGQDLPGAPGRLRPPPAGPGVHPAARPALAAAMSRHAGVIRDQESLEHFRQTLEHAPPANGGPAAGPLNLATVESTSLHAVSLLVAVAALARAESRGCHRWQGTRPVNSAERACHTLLTVAGGQPKAVAQPGVRSGE